MFVVFHDGPGIRPPGIVGAASGSTGEVDLDEQLQKLLKGSGE